MLVIIEARILIFPGTDFHFPSTSVPPSTFFRPWQFVQKWRENLGLCLRGLVGLVLW